MTDIIPKSDIAHFLNIPTDQIMMVQPYPAFVSVLLTNHQKHIIERTELEPAEPEDTPPTEEPQFIIPADVPEHLHDAYLRPQMFNRTTLRKLGVCLGIDEAENLNKRPLVTAIKKTHRYPGGSPF